MSPKAEANATTVAEEAHAALIPAQAQAEVDAHGALAAVHADVDVCRVEAAASGRAEAEARQATDAAAAARQANPAAAAATAGVSAAAAAAAAAAVPQFISAASGGVVTTAAVLHWQNQADLGFPASTRRYSASSQRKTTCFCLLVAFGTPSTAGHPRPRTSRFVSSSLWTTSPTVSRPCGAAGTRGRVTPKILSSQTAWPSGKKVLRKHCLLWGRLPKKLDEPAAVIQSFVGVAVNVTAVVVAQLRAVSDFGMAPCGPRAKGIVDHLLMVAPPGLLALGSYGCSYSWTLG